MGVVARQNRCGNWGSSCSPTKLLGEKVVHRAPPIFSVTNNYK